MSSGSFDYVIHSSTTLSLIHPRPTLLDEVDPLSPSGYNRPLVTPTIHPFSELTD